MQGERLVIAPDSQASTTRKAAGIVGAVVISTALGFSQLACGSAAQHGDPSILGASRIVISSIGERGGISIWVQRRGRVRVARASGDCLSHNLGAWHQVPAPMWQGTFEGLLRLGNALHFSAMPAPIPTSLKNGVGVNCLRIGQRNVGTTYPAQAYPINKPKPWQRRFSMLFDVVWASANLQYCHGNPCSLR